MGYSKSSLQKGVTLERLGVQNNGYPVQGILRGYVRDIDSMGSYED